MTDKGQRVSIDYDGIVTISWNDPDDAVEVGYVLISAGIGTDGRVKDHGFHDDGNAIIEAVEEWRERKAED